jgi:predicted HTH transcriptional regulator
MPPEKPSSADRTNLRISLPTTIADHYQAIADMFGKALEDVVSERLTTTADYYEDDPGRPLHFNQAERQELEKILGKNVFSTRDALVMIRNAVSLRIGSQKITLRPELLQKLKTRCLGMDWEAFITQTVTQELERFVGLR